MKEIKEYPSEFINSFSTAFDFLDRSNIKYFDHKLPKFKKYGRLLYILPCAILHFIFETLHVKSLLTNQEPISKIAWTIIIYLILFQSILKATVIITKKREMEILINDLGTIWKPEEKLTKNQIIKRKYNLKRLNTGIAVFYWGSTISNYINLSCALCSVIFKKFILHQETELYFVFGNCYPYDFTKNWFTYLLVYFLQCYSVLRIGYIYLGVQCLLITLCSQLSIAFALLREELNYFGIQTKKSFKDNSKKFLDTFLQNHQKLISLVKLLNVIFNQLVCFNFIFATFLICFLCVGTTMTQNTSGFITCVMSAIALMLPLYLLCYYAQQLQEESAGIMNSAYETLWYNRDQQFQKSICLIILRSQKPCCLTSLNYAMISLNTLTKVVSTSYSYYSLVRTIYAK